MNDNISLNEFYSQFPSEMACRIYLQKVRWSDSIICPKCNSVARSYKYANGRLYKCAVCRNQFSVRVGTILEDSKLPLQKWLLAIHLATNLTNGISSLQLSKYLEITQKSAWFMLRRIRKALNL